MLFTPNRCALQLNMLLEHFPTKWIPVRRRKCDQTKELERRSDSIGSKSALKFEVQARANEIDFIVEIVVLAVLAQAVVAAEVHVQVLELDCHSW